MSVSSAIESGNPECAVRAVVLGFVREHGPKRGLHRAAEVLGVSERWARALRFREQARVNAEVFLRLAEARRVLREEMKARHIAERAAIGAEEHADDAVAMGRDRLRVGRGSGDGGGGLLHASAEAPGEGAAVTAGAAP